MSSPPPLTLDFFARDTPTVARDLLGCVMRYGDAEGRIVETEAYAADAASHALRPVQGKLMRETHGRIYVYLIYGMHYCLNFTCDAAGPGAVLIRAVEPTGGVDAMRRRASERQPTHRIASGPGKLCKAFGITLHLHGATVGDDLRVFRSDAPPAVAASPRIGITKATDLTWRFFIPGNPCVSGRNGAQTLSERERT
jgi:DNA-3-methyladenine glycosylase